MPSTVTSPASQATAGHPDPLDDLRPDHHRQHPHELQRYGRAGAQPVQCGEEQGRHHRHATTQAGQNPEPAARVKDPLSGCRSEQDQPGDEQMTLGQLDGCVKVEKIDDHHREESEQRHHHHRQKGPPPGLRSHIAPSRFAPGNSVSAHIAEVTSMRGPVFE